MPTAGGNYLRWYQLVNLQVCSNHSDQGWPNYRWIMSIYLPELACMFHPQRGLRTLGFRVVPGRGPSSLLEAMPECARCNPDRGKSYFLLWASMSC